MKQDNIMVPPRAKVRRVINGKDDRYTKKPKLVDSRIDNNAII